MKKFFRIEWDNELEDDLDEKEIKAALEDYYAMDTLDVHQISDKVFEEKDQSVCTADVVGIEKLDWTGAVMNGQANGEFILELKKKQDELIEVVNRLTQHKDTSSQ